MFLKEASGALDNMKISFISKLISNRHFNAQVISQSWIESLDFPP